MFFLLLLPSWIIQVQSQWYWHGLVTLLVASRIIRGQSQWWWHSLVTLLLASRITKGQSQWRWHSLVTLTSLLCVICIPAFLAGPGEQVDQEHGERQQAHGEADGLSGLLPNGCPDNKVVKTTILIAFNIYLPGRSVHWQINDRRGSLRCSYQAEN